MQTIEKMNVKLRGCSIRRACTHEMIGRTNVSLSISESELGVFLVMQDDEGMWVDCEPTLKDVESLRKAADLLEKMLKERSQ